MGMRGRDIELDLKGLVDPKVIYALGVMAEDRSVMKQQMTEMAMMIDSTITQMDTLMKVMGVMQHDLDLGFGDKGQTATQAMQKYGDGVSVESMDPEDVS